MSQYRARRRNDSGSAGQPPFSSAGAIAPRADRNSSSSRYPFPVLSTSSNQAARTLGKGHSECVDPAGTNRFQASSTMAVASGLSFETAHSAFSASIMLFEATGKVTVSLSSMPQTETRPAEPVSLASLLLSASLADGCTARLRRRARPCIGVILSRQLSMSRANSMGDTRPSLVESRAARASRKGRSAFRSVSMSLDQTDCSHPMVETP
mmetsp:Transcript_27981/g.60718  ORF Transcript_27981/g.60718 Transcript_27981/m.60718 type:complete len:210 (-) Transcript_27981:430-1059(-)